MLSVPLAIHARSEIMLMPLIPWRVKNLVSERFPLIYHIIVNLGVSRNSQEYWDTQLARAWDHPSAFWPGKVAVIEKLVAPDESMVDVGCGTGSILRDLRDLGFTRLHGLEQSEYAVKRLSSEGIAMSRGDLLNMPFDDGQFDVAIASQVLEHVIRRNKFCRELSRIVRPSGKIFISVPNNRLGPISDPDHVIAYDARSFRKFLNKHWVVDSITSIVEHHNGADSLFAVCRNVKPG
jgi:2-polyprenyl-3-methyl-5-hydroxy-6-metoxy-1,4-benzoquinol methylase